jgi:hypothetical protein
MREHQVPRLNHNRPPGVALTSLGEVRLRHHPDVRPHGCMARAAELVAGHEMIAEMRKLRGECRDVSRHQHGVRVGAGDQKAMNHIGAGAAEGDFRIHRHHDALWIEGILLSDEPHDDRTVGPNLRTQILFDELARDMQRRRIDGLDSGRRHAGPVDAGEGDDAEERDDEGDRHGRPTPFRLRTDASSVPSVSAALIVEIPAAGIRSGKRRATARIRGPWRYRPPPALRPARVAGCVRARRSPAGVSLQAQSSRPADPLSGDSFSAQRADCTVRAFPQPTASIRARILGLAAARLGYWPALTSRRVMSLMPKRDR